MGPKSLAITGASAGIGRALAILYAGPDRHLMLIGRDRERLDETGRSCTAKGATVVVVTRDVQDGDGLATDLIEADGRVPLDLVIANAGVALPERDPAATRQVLAINLDGALNALLPVLPRMVERRFGQIALVSSVAALAPLADAPAYSASKAALLALGLALRERHAPDGVKISVACPGFIRTGMGARYRGARPFEISAEEAAERIARGLSRDKGVIAFPLPLVLAARASALLPERLRRFATAGFRFSIADQN